MDMKLIDKYVTETARKRQIDKDKKAQDELVRSLEVLVVREFLDEGVQNIKTSSGATCYVSTSVSARPKEGRDKTDVVRIMQEIGLDTLLKTDYNSNTLDAQVRTWITEANEEADREGRPRPELAEALPEELRDVLDLRYWQKVGVRNA